MNELTHRFAFGDKLTVKSVGGKLEVEGYAIRFNKLDLQGEYFTPKTQFMVRKWENQERPVCYDHGFNPEIGNKSLGVATLTRTDEGIYAKAVIDLSDWGEDQKERALRYQKDIEKLADDEIFAWSSGSSPYLAKSLPSGEITDWPIVEVSLTPCPVDFRNRVIRTKSLGEFTKILGENALKAGREISYSNSILLSQAVQEIKSGVSKIDELMSRQEITGKSSATPESSQQTQNPGETQPTNTNVPPANNPQESQENAEDWDDFDARIRLSQLFQGVN